MVSPVRIPGNFKRDTGVASFDPHIDAISKIHSNLLLLRDSSGETLFLLRGSKSALIGTGGGGPGLSAFLRQFIGDLPFDVAILDSDLWQVGGIAQLSQRHLYVAASAVLNGVPATVLSDGAIIDLGLNQDSQPLTREATLFQSDGVANLSLLNAADRVLFAGNAFET